VIEREARFGAPVDLGRVTVTPLVEVETAAHAPARAAARRVRPIGVIVEDDEGTRALSLDGEELPYENGQR
jgi:hypothetical protein